MTKRYIVSALWDDEAKVWVATSDDIPGLTTEARTLDTLVERVNAVAPELLDDNAHLVPGGRAQDEQIFVQIMSDLHASHAA
jgi:hypothetical protein